MLSVLFVGDASMIQDDPEMIKLFGRYGMADMGHAGSAAHAAAMLRRRPFDLVVACSGGFALLERLSRAGSVPPVVILGDRCSFRQAAVAVRCGALDLLETPFSAAELEGVLSRAAARLSAAAPAPRREPEGLAHSIFRRMISGAESEDTFEALLLAELASAVRGGQPAETVSELCRNVRGLLTDHFPWVLMLAPFETVDCAGSDAPERLFAAAVCAYARTIRVFRLADMKPTVNSVCRYLVENMMQKPSLESVSRVFCINKVYLSRLFSMQTGLSFHAYHAMLKIEYARHILLNSTFRVREISDLLGYQSADYFTGLFKKSTGCTPTQWRRLHAAGEPEKPAP